MTITYEDILDLYGTLNDLGVPDGLSGDRRTLSTTDAISSVLESAFTPDVLDGKGLFNGIVMATLPTTKPTFLSFKDNINYINSIAQNPSGELQELHFVYKVYIPEIDPREIILNTSRKKACGGLSLSQRVTTLPTAVIGSGFSEDKSQQAIVPGTLVDIRFSYAKRFMRPMIVGIGGKVFDIDYKNQSLKVTFNRATAIVLKEDFGKVKIRQPRISDDEAARFPGGIYEPRTQKAVDLLTQALRQASLPEDWAMLEATHYILKQESGGKVGIPNYRYDFVPERDPQRISKVNTKPEHWEEIWGFAKAGKTGQAGLTADQLAEGRHKGSTATGLGQLTKSNATAFYPNGLEGIGNDLSEAVGFVKYINSRYGDPDTARTMYGRKGKYINTRTKKQLNKTYEEGY